MFDDFLSGFRAKFQKRVTSVAFQSILRKQIRKLPKILKSVKIIQYYSILFIRVLSDQSKDPNGGAGAGAVDVDSAAGGPRRRANAARVLHEQHLAKR